MNTKEFAAMLNLLIILILILWLLFIPWLNDGGIHLADLGGM